MPVTTVFEIGPGKFTIVLYPSPSLSSSSSTATSKPSLTTTTYGTTRTATRSIDKNVHQVSTSIPESDYYGYNYTSTIDYLTTDGNGVTFTATTTTTGYNPYPYPYPTSTGGTNGSGNNSSGLVGATTILSGVTYTLGMEPYTWTSNGGVYTSERVMRVPVQTGSEREITEKNKSILTPIITAVVLTIVLGFLASLGGCWFYRRRRRRLGAAGNAPGTPTREKGLEGNRNRSRSNAERERGRLSRLNVDMAQVGLASGALGSGSGSGSGRGLLSASTTNPAGTMTAPGPTSTTTISPSAGNPGSSANFTRRLSVDEEDEPRIETMSIEEGTVTPFTLPAMMANAALATTGGHPATRDRTHSFSTLSTDDDAFAVDGDSIARTLTGSSLGSSNGPPAYEEIEGGTYERAMLSGMDSTFRSTLSPSLSRGSGSGLAYLEPAFNATGSNSSGTRSTLMMPRDPFADPQLLRRPTLHHQPSQSSLAESTLSSTPSSLLHPPASEGGRSERSNPQTEASFQRGDDRSLRIGDEWARIAASANNQGLPGLSVRNGSGSFQGWSDSEVEDSDDEGTIMAGSDRVLGDDESWVNGSEYGRRTRQRERDQQAGRSSNREEGDDDDDDDVFGDAHRAM